VDAADFIRSNYFDLGMILDYWGPRRLNHHTEATSMLYARAECARVLLLEGREPRSTAPAARRGDARGRAGLGLTCSATSRTR
jgi:(S)-ureidoglycine-glyoxylate aminotransferase